jgi:hypothetical protein
MKEILQPIYLPFTEDALKRHFVDIHQYGGCRSTANRHIAGLLDNITKCGCHKLLNRKDAKYAKVFIRQIHEREALWN